MRVRDLEDTAVRVGLRLRSLSNPVLQGTVVRIDTRRDSMAWIRWDDESFPRSAFYGKNCECQVVLGHDRNPIYFDTWDLTSYSS